MDITLPMLKALFYNNILLLSNKAQEVTGILNNPTPVIDPSPIDPGISHPAGYPTLHHHDYHHEKCKD